MNLIVLVKVPRSATSIDEYTTPGCTVMCRTAAAVGDGPARRASSAHTRSAWNLVPSYGRSLSTSCQSSASYALACDSSDDIHTTRAGPKPDRVCDAASCASSARHCPPRERRQHVAMLGRDRWRRTHDDIVPEQVALPYPPEPVVAHYTGALDIVARVRHELEQVEIAQVYPELLEQQRPRDTHERRNAGVAHEVRHIRVPIRADSKTPTANTGRKNVHEREETHVRATSSANASVL